MIESKSQAWIAGASGLIGTTLSKQLTASGQYAKVNRLVRTPGSDLSDVAVDYDSLSIRAIPGDDYYCCLGTTIKKAGSQEAFRLVDEKYVIRFAEEAKKNQARCLIIISSIGADARSRVFYSRVKGQMEDGVRRKSLRSVYILRPSLLMGQRNEHRASERVATLVAPLIRGLLIGSLAKYRPIEAARVAELAARYAEKAAPGFHVIENLEKL